MLILRFRFTLVFLMAMLAANLLAAGLGQDLPSEMLRDWGIGHNSLMSGEIFRLITGTFLSHDAGMLVRQFIFTAVVIGYTEWLRGTTQTAVLFFGLDIVGTLLLLVCVGAAQGAGLIDITAMNDVGMSIGGFGLIGVALSTWRYKWLLVIVIFLAIAIKLVIAPHLLADAGHVLALFLGFILGQLFALLQPASASNRNYS